MNEIDAQTHADVVELIKTEMDEIACGNYGNEERLAALITARMKATKKPILPNLPPTPWESQLNLPKKIKFGHRTIDIRYDAELSPSRHILSTGHTDLSYIEVQPSLPEAMQAECLFCGVVHQVADQCELTHDLQERRRLGIGILAVIRDNPDLISSTVLEQVRILGRDWDIVMESEHYDYAGRYISCDNTLHINSSYSGVVAWQILWHEILHVVCDKLTLDKSEGEDERDVELISFFLCMLFTQNDFSWLLEDVG